MNEIELTFLASPMGVEIVLEADGRGGAFSSGHDALTRVQVRHEDAAALDWNAEVEGWMDRLAGAGHGHDRGHGHGAHASWGHGEPYGAHSCGDHHSGPGMGTVLAAGAAGLAVGVVGALVAEEVVDEIGDFFEGDDDGDDDGDDGWFGGDDD